MALARERVRLQGRDARAAAARRAGQGAEAHDRAGAGADADLPGGDRAEEHDARRRDRRRLDPDAVLARARRRVPARCSRRASRAPATARASTTSTSRPTVNVFVTDDVESARDAMRPFVALYVGGMGSRKANFYNQLVQRYGFEDAAREVQDLYLEGKKEEATAALPGELIDTISLCGPPRRRARAAGGLPRRRGRDADGLADGRGRSRNGASSCGSSPSWPLEDLPRRLRRSGPRLPDDRAGRRAGGARPRGRAGHVAQVARAGRGGGHDVHRGARVPGLPDAGQAAEALRGGRAGGARDPAVRAARSRPTSRSPTSSRPARRWPPSSRACRWRRSCPTSTRSSPTATRSTRSARGSRAPRPGAALWRWGNRRFVQGSLEEGRDQYNETRRRLGLEPLPYVHTALSRELTMVGTLPQLEYPRDWEPWVKVVGPLQWEPPGERVDPPPGRGPVVLVAPSTSQDPSHRLLRAALEGLAGAPVRVIATYNGREPKRADHGAGQRRARAVAVVLEDDAAVRRGRAPRRPRDARARAGRGLRGRGVPGGRRHERERRAGRLGRRRGADPPRWLGARTLQLAVRRALRPEIRARVAEVARVGGGRTTARCGRPRSSRRGRQRGELRLGREASSSCRGGHECRLDRAYRG